MLNALSVHSGLHHSKFWWLCAIDYYAHKTNKHLSINNYKQHKQPMKQLQRENRDRGRHSEKQTVIVTIMARLLLSPTKLKLSSLASRQSLDKTCWWLASPRAHLHITKQDRTINLKNTASTLHALIMSAH